MYTETGGQKQQNDISFVLCFMNSSVDDHTRFVCILCIFNVFEGKLIHAKNRNSGY